MYILAVLFFTFWWNLAMFPFIEGEKYVIEKIALSFFAERILKLHNEVIAIAH